MEANSKKKPRINKKRVENKHITPLLPMGTYIGSEIIEGYEILLLPEMDTPYRRNEALKKAEHNAIKEALKRAYELSKNGAPDCEDGFVPAMSIIMSAPKEEPGYTEEINVKGLPPEAAALAPKYPSPAGQKYKIVAVSMEWTARWVILPASGINFPENDGIIPSGIINYIGDTPIDFGCPKPIKNNIVIRDMIYDQVDHVHVPLETFKTNLNAQVEKIRKETETAVFEELEMGIMYLPRCPLDQVSGGLSITIGYPKTYAIIYKEIKYHIEKQEYIPDPTLGRVLATVLHDQFRYEISGEWSWSVQRTCLAPAKPVVRKKRKAVASKPKSKPKIKKVIQNMEITVPEVI
ncbi:MAG: hypothetical protein WCL14_05790 [Bacteroidota bacterium]